MHQKRVIRQWMPRSCRKKSGGNREYGFRPIELLYV